MINRFSLYFKWALAAMVLTIILAAQAGVGASPIKNDCSSYQQ
jgi:hypothetical protein